MASNPYRARSRWKEWADDDATKYALDVASGKTPAGELHVLACQRHLDDLLALSDPQSYLRYDPTRLKAFTAFCWKLCRVENAVTNKTERLDLIPWHKFVFGSFLGWKIKSQELDPFKRLVNTRRFRTIYIETPKGTGKTPGMAAISLWHLDFTFDRELNPEIVVTSAKKEQVEPFTNALEIILRGSKYWFDRETRHANVVPRNGRYELLDKDGDGICVGFIQPVSGRQSQVAGKRCSLIYVDEYSSFNNRALIRKLLDSGKSRRQPSVWYTTNAGNTKGDTDCWDVRMRCEAILRGQIEDDSTFALISARDEDDPMYSPKTWRKVNHSLGITVREDYYRLKMKEAKESAVAKRDFRQYYLGDWPDEAASDWLGGENTKRALECCIPEDEFPDDKKMRSGVRRCLSYDLALTGDTIGYCEGSLIDGILYVRPKVFACEDVIAEINSWDLVPFRQWAEADHVTPCGERTNDYNAFARFLVQRAAELKAWDTCFDPYYVSLWYEALQDEGIRYIHPKKTKEFKRQGDPRFMQAPGTLRLLDHPNNTFRARPGQLGGLYMHDSITKLKYRLMHGTIRIIRNPALTWAIQTVQVPATSKGLWFDKDKTFGVKKGKIDVLASLAYLVGFIDYEGALGPKVEGFDELPSFDI